MDAIRSLLFVPGDDERKIVKGLAGEADALILDLEDSVHPQKRSAARALCLSVLKGGPAKKIFVRINELDADDAIADLAAVVQGRPYGIVLPKCRSAADIARLDHYITALEARDELPGGEMRIVPIVTETGASLFGGESYRGKVPRLAGLLWGGEDLAADIGAAANRDEANRYTAPYEFARTFCLIAAAASRSAAIDAVFTDFRDLVGLRCEAQAAARDGFVAKAAIHPDQVAIINEAFMPNSEAVAYAQSVIECFEREAQGGVVALDGKMLDRPHFVAARRILRRAHRAS